MKTLIVLLGPTAVGKTKLSICLARFLNIPIFNADSRQLFRDLKIGTAAPTKEEQQEVQHFFVGTLALDEYYSAARFEEEALQLLENHFKTHDTALLCGGSMLYIDAVCNGIDDIPSVDEITRRNLKERLTAEGLDKLREELRLLDPQTYSKIDQKNPRRIVHALEIYYSSGKPLSSYLKQETKQRPFNILKIGLQRERADLFERINTRVDQMISDGFIEEAKQLYSRRHLNALNTVGYKELFHYLDGEWTLDFAIEKIKKNTRDYAKKQMTWFKRDPSIHWFHPDDKEKILNFIHQEVVSNINR